MMIPTISGRQLDTKDIQFDSSTYHFTRTSTGEDLTDDLFRRDKLALVDGFDVTEDNKRLSRERGGGGRVPENLPTNTWDVFTDQILTDPLDAPVGAIESVGETLKEAVIEGAKSAGTGVGQSVVPLAVIGLAVAAFFYFKGKL